MGFTIVVLVASIGTLVGSLAGYFGGKVEMVLMRLCDIMISFPGIVLAIAIAGIMGGSVGNTILALTIVGWAKYARLVRSLVIKVRQEDYISGRYYEWRYVGRYLASSRVAKHYAARRCNGQHGPWRYDARSSRSLIPRFRGTTTDTGMGVNAQ